MADETKKNNQRSVLSENYDNADLLMSEHPTAVTNQTRNEVWRKATGGAFTRGAAVQFTTSAVELWGGGRVGRGGGGGELSES